MSKGGGASLWCEIGRRHGNEPWPMPPTPSPADERDTSSSSTERCSPLHGQERRARPPGRLHRPRIHGRCRGNLSANLDRAVGRGLGTGACPVAGDHRPGRSVRLVLPLAGATHSPHLARTVMQIAQEVLGPRDVGQREEVSGRQGSNGDADEVAVSPRRARLATLHAARAAFRSTRRSC